MRPAILLLLPFTSSLAAAQTIAPQPAPQRETIVVTGTFEPLSLEEMDRAIRVLPAREHALVLNTLADLLRLDPSLDLQERAPGGVQADLSIRGAGFGKTLVLLNGERMNDAQSGHHNLDIPTPLEAVSRIEVLRGSGSAMYGSDAAGGVVNIITEPPEAAEFRLRAGAGNFGINQQRGSIAAAAGPLSEQIAFSRDFSSGFVPGRDYRNLQFLSATRLRPALGTGTLTLAYMDHPFGADQFYGNYNSWENTKTWFAGVRQAIGARTSAAFSFRRHSDLFVLYRDRPEVFANHHSDESWQASLRRRETPARAVTVSYGVEALHESIVSNNLGEHARGRGAAYAGVDFRALRRFSLSLSAREEAYRRFSGEFSPSAAAGLWLSPRFKLRASASRAFRVPTYTDLYYHDPANIGSPGLRPERVWSYEGGADWNASAKLRAEATVFHRRERDGIDYFRVSPADIWRAVNIQRLNFTGVETGLRLIPASGQTIDFRYTGLHGAQGAIRVGETKYAFNYPAHSGVAQWLAEFRGAWLLRTRLGVLDRRARDPYAVWDLYASSSRGNLHPFLQVSNVTATRYQEILGVAMPGRTLIGGVEWVVRLR